MSEEIAKKAMERIIKVFRFRGFGLNADTHHDIVEVVDMYCREMVKRKKEEEDGSVNSDS